MTTSSQMHEPQLDVYAAGMLFYDIVAAHLPASGPVPGQEIWTGEYGHGPGGIANFAMTTARLGLKTAVSAVIGNDVFGRLCTDALANEGIDLSFSPQMDDWSTPVTMALGYGGDRALVTAGVRTPSSDFERQPSTPPQSRFVIAHLEAQSSEWLRRAHANGSKIVADVGWDESETWDPHILDKLQYCFAFMPNDREARAYTSTSSPSDAAHALSERVPITIVTCGADGALAVDARTDEVVRVPALPVSAVDSTGAGDVFGGAIVYALTRDWTVEQSVSFATLIAGLSTLRAGGGSAAPDWPEIMQWLHELAASESIESIKLRQRFAFLAAGNG